MIRKSLLLCLLVLPSFSMVMAKDYVLRSPDKRLVVNIDNGKTLSYSVSDDKGIVLAPSNISMKLSDGEEWGVNSKVQKVEKVSVDNKTIVSPFYKKASIPESYNGLTLKYKEFAVEFRAYNDGVAYRFVSLKKDNFNVASEQAEFVFTDNFQATVPYVNKAEPKSFEEQFFNSFENTYTIAKLSDLENQRLMFLPLVVSLDQGRKVCITEVNLEGYPGMYLNNTGCTNGLKGVFAPYPKKEEQGGHNRLQMLVKEREDYIAKVEGKKQFPWRAMVITQQDKELANSDLVYKLADESRIDDISWIKPGKVAWEWWNNWGISNVDFVAGINNDTYKAYIDFASANKIEYVILDEGWAVNLQADLFQIVPEIDLEKLVAYANQKNVGLILWAGYHAFERDLENICKVYSKMGIKGFKVDFMDRDDQKMTEFLYRAADVCAKYNMLLDYHGIYKPTGLLRTYPNVLNYEGVYGLEQLKWTSTVDMPANDVTLPFIRLVAGPMDYTQGAMRNAARWEFRAVNSQPMSQGTRCHQLGEYVVFESPINMLCDSPTSYMDEPESTAFIAAIPTVWDETVIIDGVMGEYIATARRSGDVWYVGAITNWAPRNLELDFSFLGNGDFEMTYFKDGLNANKIASDYKMETVTLSKDKKMKANLAAGGGFAAKIVKK